MCKLTSVVLLAVGSRYIQPAWGNDIVVSVLLDPAGRLYPHLLTGLARQVPKSGHFEDIYTTARHRQRTGITGSYIPS